MNFALAAAVLLGGLAALGWAIRLVVRGPRLLAIPIGYLGVVAFAWVTMAARTGGYRPETPPDEYAATRPTEGPLDDYVTSDTCRSCHPGEYHSWHASYHRTMTQVATPESVKGDFDSKFVGEFRDGMNVRFSREGDEFWATYAFMNPAGGYRAVEKRRIVMTTGSHHYQVYWTDQPSAADEEPGDRSVWLVPHVFLFDEQQWVPRYASFLMPATGKAEFHQWSQSCVKCHSTHGIPRNSDRGGAPDFYDTRTVELGISCEACHGPAREHIAANRDPLRRYRFHKDGEGDPTIVNPARLDKKRSADTCGQCHSVNIPETPEEGVAWRRFGKPYRPGRDLHDNALVIHPGTEKMKIFEEHFPDIFEDRFWSDGMVRVAGREYHGLLETPCFQRGEMTCLSCHSMHRERDDPRSDLDWANDQLKPDLRGNAACVQCHESYAEPGILTKHTHHPAGSSGSNCYNCHMPHTSYGLLKGIRSHQIDSPSVKVALETGRPNACNLCHLDQTLAWTADHLESWYGHPQPELDNDQKSVAASLLGLLTGDAGQRALVASAMGRREPQAISGTDWMPPFLAQLNYDPYHAVQIIANKSLRTIDGFAGIPRYPSTPEAGREAYAIWKEEHGERRDEPALLLNAEGKVEQTEMLRLLKQRDDTPVNLKE